jgi:hypothetical protein
MKHLLLAISLLATTSIFAESNRTHLSRLDNQVKIQLRNQIGYPEYLKAEEGDHEADLTFTLDSLGAIEVVNVASTDTKLKQYLVEQSSHIHIDMDEAVGQAGGTYRIHLQFRLL